MARINNLTNFLTDVASAIKEKKGDSTNIPAEEFDIEILALSGGGNYQTKTLNITSNGTQIVTPDQDYDAIEQLTITTNVPIASLQSKSYTFTTNQTMTLSPDTGYDGFSSVEVTVNVSGGSGDVKLFATEQAMQNDPNPSEGDLAVVYNNDMASITSDSVFTEASFPDIVILDTAITTSSSATIQPVTGGTILNRFQVSLSATSFRIYRSFLGSVTVTEYTSSDGITYTRLASMDETYTFDTEMQFSGTWKDEYGEFIKTSAFSFEGLFQYNNKQDEDFILGFTDFNNTGSAITTTSVTLEIADIISLMRKVVVDNDLNYIQGTVVIHNDNIIIYSLDWNDTTGKYGYATDIAVDSSRGYILHSSTAGTIVDGVEKITLDLQNKTYSVSKLTHTNTIYGQNYADTFSLSDKIFIIDIRSDGDVLYDYIYAYYKSGSHNTLTSKIGSAYKYRMASMQLTATADYVYEKVFYGQDGAEEGTLQSAVTTIEKLNIDMNIWNVLSTIDISAITDMTKGFYNNTNLISMPLLDTNNVTNMRSMFSGCTNLTSVPLFDTSNVTDMLEMFYNCQKLESIPLLNTENVTTMSGMFFQCYKLTTIPLLDTSNVTNMRYMFDECMRLTSIPLLDTSNVTDMDNMFDHCSDLETIPLLDTSNVTNMHCMFRYCTSLTTVPTLNTSNVTNMDGMFVGCTNLTSVPLFDTSNVTDIHQAFTDCSSLTSVPQFDISNVTNTNGMFLGCTNLITVPVLNARSVTVIGSMFQDCPNLSNESLNNILTMCTGATNSTYKTLKYLGLSETQANTCKTLSNYSAFTAAGWTTGY